MGNFIFCAVSRLKIFTKLMEILKHFTIFSGKFLIINFSGKKSSTVQDFYKKLAQLATAFKDALAGTNVFVLFSSL